MCARVCAHGTHPHAYMIYSHAIQFQAASTGAMRLADVLLVGRKIRGVTDLRGFRLKKRFLPSSAREQPYMSACV